MHGHLANTRIVDKQYGRRPNAMRNEYSTFGLIRLQIGFPVSKIPIDVVGRRRKGIVVVVEQAPR